LDCHADLLRASVASSGNDHRLGANEAPPAILSIYTGEELQRVLDKLAVGELVEFEHGTTIDLGAAAMPILERHPGDRNRTSPFAFIGNRFEFRAVGSTAVPAWPMAVLNTIVAESLDFIATALEACVNDSQSQDERMMSIMGVLKDVYNQHSRVVFNGDNYTQAWQDEAARRGLPNLRGCADALPALGTPVVHKLFNDYHVLGESELTARQLVLFETYATQLEIEARTMLRMIRTMITPAAIRHQGEMAQTIAATEQVGVEHESVRGRLIDLTAHMTAMELACVEIEATLRDLPEDPEACTRTVQDVLVPIMERARASADAIESLVPDDLWPFPTYLDMLF
jgi:glutamine synthetase